MGGFQLGERLRKHIDRAILIGELIVNSIEDRPQEKL